jgi:hypothetical protein
MTQQEEIKFCEILTKLQKQHNAYWIQTKHIANELFGINDTWSEKNRHTMKMRVHRIANKLKDFGVTSTIRWESGVGQSTGKIQVKYYHIERVRPD